MIRKSEESIAANKKADREIDLMENLQVWLTTNLHGSDLQIAERVEEEFGWSKEIVYKHLQAGLCQRSTFESIWEAYLEESATP